MARLDRPGGLGQQAVGLRFRKGSIPSPWQRVTGQRVTADAGRAKLSPQPPVVHYAPGDSLLCGLEESPEPMTPDPELVRGCGDAETVLSWWPRTCPTRTDIHGPLPPLQSGNPCQGRSRLASGGPEPLPALRQTGVVKR